jgi:hypothetical protein
LLINRTQAHAVAIGPPQKQGSARHAGLEVPEERQVCPKSGRSAQKADNGRIEIQEGLGDY